MKGRRHSPERVVRLLREVNQLVGEGRDLDTVAKQSEISGANFHPRHHQYGGLKAEDAKGLRRLRDENERLRPLVADGELQIEMLKEISRGDL